MSPKREKDIWNEKSDKLGELMEVEAEQFVDNVARNKEGSSALKEKFIFDETTTPKLLPPNKRS
ncbi:hypothetical protein [Phosphitispora fastidiosa]|uniref:hypothetical protein n=1 Tax=Phosphitispora fastidiosa TaxID=2837202 RepID=UPI001E4F9376|nr:hypothetical protein [Phosphitispora fastidiosa]MBU7006806.1 hypothetical protein [Phosphitispora fastidiosa]